MKRVLVIGASSFIGSQLCVTLRQFYSVHGTYAKHKPRIDGVPLVPLNLETNSPIDPIVLRLQPQTVIYCAGERDETKCESDPRQALFINAEAPSILAAAAAQSGGRFIYLSTVKVFSGEHGDYSEQDEPNPISAYGKTKLGAESLLSHYENTFILRLGSLYGISFLGADSVLQRLLHALWTGTETALILDEPRSFFSCDELSRLIQIIIEASNQVSGIYHISNGDELSYFDFGKLVAKTFGISADIFKPISGSEFQAKGFNQAQRGIKSTLNGKHFSDTFSFQYQSTETCLDLLRRKLRDGKQ